LNYIIIIIDFQFQKLIIKIYLNFISAQKSTNKYYFCNYHPTIMSMKKFNFCTTKLKTTR